MRVKIDYKAQQLNECRLNTPLMIMALLGVEVNILKFQSKKVGFETGSLAAVFLLLIFK